MIEQEQRINRSRIEEFGYNNTEVSQIGDHNLVGEALAVEEPKKHKERVLDRMARIVMNQEPNKTCIFSYHYEYKDFLEYYGFTDVSFYNTLDNLNIAWNRLEEGREAVKKDGEERWG